MGDGGYFPWPSIWDQDDAANVRSKSPMTEDGEIVEAMARAVERDTNPQWDDDQFEYWWRYCPFFVSKVEVWSHFRGTRKQRRLHEARLAYRAYRERMEPL